MTDGSWRPRCYGREYDERPGHLADHCFGCPFKDTCEIITDDFRWNMRTDPYWSSDEEG